MMWCCGGVVEVGAAARGPEPVSLAMLAWVDRVEVAEVEALGRVLGVGRSALYSHVGRLAAAGGLLPGRALTVLGVRTRSEPSP